MHIHSSTSHQRLFWQLTEAFLLSRSHFIALKRGDLPGALVATHHLHAVVWVSYNGNSNSNTCCVLVARACSSSQERLLGTNSCEWGIYKLCFTFTNGTFHVKLWRFRQYIKYSCLSGCERRRGKLFNNLVLFPELLCICGCYSPAGFFKARWGKLGRSPKAALSSILKCQWHLV